MSDISIKVCGMKEPENILAVAKLDPNYMEEAESLCDHIIILDEGKILREGQLHELLDENSHNLDELFINLTGKKLNEENHIK